MFNTTTYNEWKKTFVDGGSKEGLEKTAENGTLKLTDIVIRKSVGAKSLNYDVLDLKRDKHFHPAEGTKIQNIEVFAGKGVKGIGYLATI